MAATPPRRSGASLVAAPASQVLETLALGLGRSLGLRPRQELHTPPVPLALFCAVPSGRYLRVHPDGVLRVDGHSPVDAAACFLGQTGGVALHTRTRFLFDDGRCLAASEDGEVSLRPADDVTTQWRVEERLPPNGAGLRLRSRHGSLLCSFADGSLRCVRAGPRTDVAGQSSTSFWLVNPQEEEARLLRAAQLALAPPPPPAQAWHLQVGPMRVEVPPGAPQIAAGVAAGVVTVAVMAGALEVEAAIFVAAMMWEAGKAIAADHARARERNRARERLMERRAALPPPPPQPQPRQHQQAGEERLCECCICLDTVPSHRGVSCRPFPARNAHFLCSGCLNTYIASEASAEPAHLQRTGGSLLCPQQNCAAPPFPEAALAVQASPAAFEMHLAALVRSREAAVVAEIEQGFEARVRAAAQAVHAEAAAGHAEAEGAGGGDGRAKAALAAVRRRVVEDLLTTRCPRCKAAFGDFDGCFALSCGRCGAAFCGWCLRDCGEDAHPHVRTCGSNPRQGDLFGDKTAYFESGRRRAEAALRKMLAGFPDVTFRRAVVEACVVDLQGVGIGQGAFADLLAG